MLAASILGTSASNNKTKKHTCKHLLAELNLTATASPLGGTGTTGSTGRVGIGVPDAPSPPCVAGLVCPGGCRGRGVVLNGRILPVCLLL